MPVQKNKVPEKERFIQCCGDISLELVASLKSSKDINLNGLITRYAKNIN